MSYIHVRLLNGFPQLLTYAVPASITDDLVGTVVKVPLKDRVTSAYVCAQVTQLKNKPSFIIKDIHSIEAFPKDPYYKTFLKQLSAYYQVEPLHFVKRIKHFVNQEADAQIESPGPIQLGQHIILTDEQRIVVDTLAPSINANAYAPALLHG